MSIGHEFGVNDGLMAAANSPVPGRSTPPALHCIADTRRRQGLSLRSVARRLGKTVDQVRRLEEPTNDMMISELYEWQQALEVPIVDLLVDASAPLSAPVLARARLVRAMKTVRAIKESTKCVSTERMATMLEQQLMEIMPELKDVSAWHSVGQRRSHNELGKTAEQIVPETFYLDGNG